MIKGNLHKFAKHKDTTFFFINKTYNYTILKSKDTLLAIAKRTILSESESVAKLVNYLNDDFVETVKLINQCNGRLVITGIGKSAIIAQKITATMNSTGTPSMFMHAAEAIHGDLGMLQKDDIVICISKSGNSPEIKILVPIIKRFGNILIGMTGNVTSFLAKESDYILNTTVDTECCPLNLAPTNSTTSQLVMGDALAICLMELNDFKSEDFAKYHPGGSLGKKLLFRVKDMLENSLRPEVKSDDSIKKVIFEISEKRLGVTAVLENEKLTGIITDGDIRRMLTKTDSIAHLTAKDIMTINPKTVKSDDMVVDALNLMEDFSITQLIVVDNDEYKGVIHLHDILKEGIV